MKVFFMLGLLMQGATALRRMQSRMRDVHAQGAKLNLLPHMKEAVKTEVAVKAGNPPPPGAPPPGCAPGVPCVVGFTTPPPPPCPAGMVCTEVGGMPWWTTCDPKSIVNELFAEHTAMFAYEGLSMWANFTADEQLVLKRIMGWVNPTIDLATLPQACECLNALGSSHIGQKILAVLRMCPTFVGLYLADFMNSYYGGPTQTQMYLPYYSTDSQYDWAGIVTNPPPQCYLFYAGTADLHKFRCDCSSFDDDQSMWYQGTADNGQGCTDWGNMCADSRTTGYQGGDSLFIVCLPIAPDLNFVDGQGQCSSITAPCSTSQPPAGGYTHQDWLDFKQKQTPPPYEFRKTLSKGTNNLGNLIETCACCGLLTSNATVQTHQVQIDDCCSTWVCPDPNSWFDQDIVDDCTCQDSFVQDINARASFTEQLADNHDDVMDVDKAVSRKGGAC